MLRSATASIEDRTGRAMDEWVALVDASNAEWGPGASAYDQSI